MVNFFISEAPRTFAPHFLGRPKIGSSSTPSFLITPRLIKLVKSKWVCKALNLSSSVHFALNGMASVRYFAPPAQSTLVGSFHGGFYHHETTLFIVFNQCEHQQCGTLNFLFGLRWNAQIKFGKVTDRLTAKTSCPSYLRPNQWPFQHCCTTELEPSLLPPFYRCFRGHFVCLQNWPFFGNFAINSAVNICKQL